MQLDLFKKPIISKQLNWLAAWNTQSVLLGSKMSGTTPVGVGRCSNVSLPPSAAGICEASACSRSSESVGVLNSPTWKMPPLCFDVGHFSFIPVSSMEKSNWVLLYDCASGTPKMFLNHMAMGTTDATTTNAKEPRSFVIIIVDLRSFRLSPPAHTHRGAEWAEV